jgi:hypothetical protein
MNLVLSAAGLIGLIAIVFWIAYGEDSDTPPSDTDQDRIRAWVELGQEIHPSERQRWAERRIKDPTLRHNVVLALTCSKE